MGKRCSFTEMYVDATKLAKKIPQNAYEDRGSYPIIDQGKQAVAGRWNSREEIFTQIPAIIFGDHTRAIKFVEEPFFVGADGVKVLVPANQDDNAKFLYYALSAARIPDLGYSRHFKAVKELTFIHYGRKEQDEIVLRLEKVDRLIEQMQAECHLLDQLVKSRFIEMFGDMADPECTHTKCKLSDICTESDDIKCGPFGTQLSKDEYQSSGIAVWEIPQVNSGFNEAPIHYVTKEKAEQLKTFSLISGDIAMSRKGNVGRCGLFPEGYPDGIIHSDVLRIRVDKKRVNPCFLMCQFHYSGDVQRQIEMVSSGAIMAGINVTKLKLIEVYVPDINLQNQFTAFVQATDKSCC